MAVWAVGGLRGWRVARLAVLTVGGLGGWRVAGLASCAVGGWWLMVGVWQLEFQLPFQ